MLFESVWRVRTSECAICGGGVATAAILLCFFSRRLAFEIPNVLSVVAELLPQLFFHAVPVALGKGQGTFR